MTMTNRTQKIGMLAAAGLLAVAAAPARDVSAQAAPAQLNVAFYAPSADFKDSSARSAYVQGLAKAIQTKTGIPTTGRAYARYSDLKSAKPDFAIIDGQCLAVSTPGPVLATAVIGGGTSQPWALFTRGDNFTALKGKKLAYVETGCNDVAFLDNAMLDSEAKVKAHFASLVGKPEASGAVATVRDYKQADAVFAPSGVVKGGLNKIFDAGQVPNPGFVQLNKNLGGGVPGNVQAAVLAYSANLSIEGWKAAASYAGLAGQMTPRNKKPVFAVPDVVRMDDQDVLVIPQSKYEQAGIRQHFWQPGERR